MKSYEQMTEDVLKRRDEELAARSNKLAGATEAVIPCVSVAAIVGVVCGTGILIRYTQKLPENNPELWQNSCVIESSAPGQPASSVGFSSENTWQNSASSGNSSMCVPPNEYMSSNPYTGESSAVSTIDIDVRPANPNGFDIGVSAVETHFANPKAGQTSDIMNVIVVNKFNLEQKVMPDSNDLSEYSMEQLYNMYGIEFDRLTGLHPEWTESHDRLGVYKRCFEETGVVGMSMYCTRNTLNYTTDTGAKLSVSAQITDFDPISDEISKILAKPILSEVINKYDENGNLIGQNAPGYNPDKNMSQPTADDLESLINGYKMSLYCEDISLRLAADIEIGSTSVRFTAEGLTEQEFCKIIDEYTR